MSRQLKNLALGLVFGLVASTGATATAHPGLTGELGELEAGQYESLEVAKVQPTAFTDVSSSRAVGEVVAMAEGAEAEIVDVSADVEAPEEDGLGFGGNSRSIDVVSLKYGYMLSTLPLLEGDKLKSVAKDLAELGQLNAFYSPEVAKHLIALVHGAETGQADAAALTAIMTAAAQGIASATDSDGERIHGYLLTGLWLGLAQMTSVTGQANVEFSDLGKTIASMLEKDAAFGGSDLAIAKELRSISAQLADSPDKAIVSSSVKVVLATKADG